MPLEPNRDKDRQRVATVVIGRNEGPRLKRCLDALGDVALVIYVDSGSNDGSQALAAQAGAQVVDLDMSMPFTAARARNAGMAHLKTMPGAAQEFVQFLDGDCEMRDGWLAQAVKFLDDHSQVAVVCGRRRERYPERSIYNAMADIEWDTPIGQAKACGGDALMRINAFDQVGGYDPNLIAGEEPELCVRLRQANWQVWRLDAEMTWHDADLMHLSQWWTRARRAGFAYAQGAHMHGAPPERHKTIETRRALIWGLAIPGLAILGVVLISPWLILLMLAWPAQVIRLRSRCQNWTHAGLMVLGKLPEALGVLNFHWRRLISGKTELIEYKLR